MIGHLYTWLFKIEGLRSYLPIRGQFEILTPGKQILRLLILLYTDILRVLKPVINISPPACFFVYDWRNPIEMGINLI